MVRDLDPTPDGPPRDSTAALRHPDKNVRISAALTLGDRRDRAALTDLVAGLRDDPDFFVRETVTWALMRLGDASVDPLIDLSRDTSARVRLDAVHALSKVGYDRAASAVWERLWDSEPRVVAKAAYTLGVFRERGAVPELVALLSHDVPEVRTAAAEALSRLGTLAVTELERALSDGTADIRRRLVDVLSSIPGPRSVGALRTAVADGWWEVRVSALMALSSFDDEDARAAIRSAVDDGDHRVAALATRLLAS